MLWAKLAIGASISGVIHVFSFIQRVGHDDDYLGLGLCHAGLRRETEQREQQPMKHHTGHATPLKTVFYVLC